MVKVMLTSDQLLVLWTMNILAHGGAGLSPGVILTILDFWEEVTPPPEWS